MRSTDPRPAQPASGPPPQRAGKLFYKIGSVCEITGTQPYILRFWESEFPQLAPQKSRSGQRLFRERDIETVRRIKQLLYEEGYTIPGARKRLEQEESERAPVPAASQTPAPVPSAAQAPPEASARRAGAGARAPARAPERAPSGQPDAQRTLKQVRRELEVILRRLS
jgi:DNA-binding transcriptional MerR regulator